MVDETEPWYSTSDELYAHPMVLNRILKRIFVSYDTASV